MKLIYSKYGVTPTVASLFLQNITKQSRQTSARPLCSLSWRIARTASAPIDDEDDVKFGDQKTLYAFPRPGQ